MGMGMAVMLPSLAEVTAAVAESLNEVAEPEAMTDAETVMLIMPPEGEAETEAEEDEAEDEGAGAGAIPLSPPLPAD